MEQLSFFIFAALAIASALGVVSARNPVHSALLLMVCLFQVAALFVLLRSPFLATVQVFIYVGAIMVLFLFVIMMLDVRKATIERFIPGGHLLVMVVLVVLISEISFIVRRSRLTTLSVATDNHLDGSVMEMGKTLFTEYLLPFEVVSVILLVAMVGAIVMGRKEIK